MVTEYKYWVSKFEEVVGIGDIKSNRATGIQKEQLVIYYRTRGYT